MRQFTKVIFLLMLFCGMSQTTFSQEILYNTFTDRGKTAFADGKFLEAEKLLQSALDEAEKLKNPELIASASTNLGKVLHSQEKYENAEKLYLRAIEIFDKIDGENQERSAFAMNNLGLLYTEQKKFDKAEEVLRKTISIREKILGAAAPDVAVTMLNLGKLYADQSKYTEADAVYVRSLEILVQHSDYTEEILICLHNISDATYHLKEFKRAEAAYKLTIGIIERDFGKNSPRLINPLTNYAEFLRKLKRNAEAVLVEKRIRILKQAKR
jgi:tetratricopeptide (TPR) repeat protein